ncbi:MAG: ABC transporter ATP-binding protein [Bacteroidota bacterium]|nr:ABC transporter ATP-binding protein [Bacteroidota bacterium]
MIEIRNLQKTYNKHTVLDISTLAIPEGQSFGLVGNNGAGKTTLFRLILDLIKADSGEVFSNNKPVNLNDDWKAYTGSYLDEGFLIPFLTALEYFQFVAKLYNIPKDHLNEVLAPYESFLTEEILKKKTYIRDLSKGNQNKVGIVSALLMNPKVLVLDEPFANLDPSSQIKLKKILIEKRNQKQTTMLISSHDLSYLFEISERIVILENGIIKNDIQTENTTLIEIEKYFEVA